MNKYRPVIVPVSHVIMVFRVVLSLSQNPRMVLNMNQLRTSGVMTTSSIHFSHKQYECTSTMLISFRFSMTVTSFNLPNTSKKIAIENLSRTSYLSLHCHEHEESHILPIIRRNPQLRFSIGTTGFFFRLFISEPQFLAARESITAVHPLSSGSLVDAKKD